MEEVNRIIAIGDGTQYQMRCFSVGKYSSKWILEHFVHNRFLWWTWSKWEVLIGYTNFGAGETEQIFDVRKRHDEDDEVVMYAGEGELDFLGLEYK